MAKNNGAAVAAVAPRMFQGLDDVMTLLRAFLMGISSEGFFGIPFILRGGSGIGKTSIVKQLGQELGLSVITVLPNLREPTELAMGLPTIWKGDGEPEARFIAPAWAKAAQRLRRTVVFFDEGNAAQSLQNAMLRVALERVAGELVLPSTCRVALAMNETQDSAGGHDLAPALANRFGHVPFPRPTEQEFSEHLIGTPVVLRERAAVDILLGDEKIAEREEAKVVAAWADSYAWAAGLVSAFIKKRGALLYQQPEASDEKSSGAWASPRSWKEAGCALASCKLHGLSRTLMRAAVSSLVGPAAGEFFTYLEYADLPDALDVLGGKTKWQHDPNRLDRTLVFFEQVGARLADKKLDKREQYAVVAWKLLRQHIEGKYPKELAYGLMRLLVNAGLRVRANADVDEVLFQLASVGAVESQMGGAR